MGYKVWYNYILFKLGKRKILPSKIINLVKVSENNEKLIKIINSNIIVDKKVKYPYLRESLILKLDKVSEMLEVKGYKLKIYDAYRSYDDQKKSWDKRLKETRIEHPNVDIKELERLTSLKVAKPTKGHGGHQTGGAIDVTLIDKDGNEQILEAEYYIAKVLQHEIDHTNGISFIDRLESYQKRRLKKELKELRNNTVRGIKKMNNRQALQNS